MISSEAGRPGTTYYVPGVRVVKLGPIRPGPTVVVDRLEEVQYDILSVRVTRVNSGASQFCITLNNWFDTLPADRAEGAGRRELLRGGQPLWPRFKYNDFALLNFGTRVRIDMRYFPDPAEGVDETAALSHNWVPMIAGPITDMRFTFSTEEGAKLEVCGEDDLCHLKVRPPTRTDYWGEPEEDIVRDVLRRAGFPLDLAPPRVPWPSFISDSAKGLAEAHEEGQTYLEYLTRFAERFDFEVFVEFEDLSDPDSAVLFHFEPARSRLPPDRTLRDIYVLERERNLIEFTPTFRVQPQYTSVTVRGRHRVARRPRRISVTATPDILDDELHRDEARGDPPLVPGPVIRGDLLGPNPEVKENETNIDEERARVIAEGILRRRAREFLTIQAKTLGLPRLRPGLHVEIRGMRPPFDGFYYAYTTVHTYGNDGFRTAIDARRPGMPVPPYGET